MADIVKTFELELLSPQVRKSEKRLGELLAEDFFEFTQSGKIHTKQDIIDTLPSCPEEVFRVREYQERELSESIILTHYIADREIIETGKKRCTLCSSLWRRSGENWEMIFFQGTPV